MLRVLRLLITKSCIGASLSQVLETMASGTEGNQVSQPISTKPAAGLQMVDLQVSEGPTQLTTPVVSRQNLFAESTIVFGVEFPARLPLAEHAHSVFSPPIA